MTHSSMPFDDPEFQDLLRQSGVEHRPGLADELMAELEPLLAADGFDIQNLDETVDLEALNAAMGRAVERHNMEAVTPVGEARHRTVNLLRTFILEFGRGRQEQVAREFVKLRNKPTATRVSNGHLAGVTLEFLDNWYTNDDLKSALEAVSLDDIHDDLRGLVAEIRDHARNGRAFTSIDQLHRGEHPVVYAAVYLAAASLVTIAQTRQQSLGQLVDELIPKHETAASAAPGAAFGTQAAQQLHSDDVLEQFQRWLQDREHATPEVEFAAFASLAAMVTKFGVDLYEAGEFPDVLAAVTQHAEQHATPETLSILQDYLDFQRERGEDPEGWREAEQALQAALPDESPASQDMEALLDHLADIEPAQRRAALLGAPVISGIADLLELIGSSRPITSTGAPRRVDIQPFCAALGISAQGVARLPDITADQDDDRTRYAQTAWQIPELVVWWQVLEDMDVLQLSATKVFPGPKADMFRDPVTANLETLEAIVASIVRNYALAEVGHMPVGLPGVLTAFQRLLTAMDPTADSFQLPFAIPQDFTPSVVEMVSNMLLKSFAEMGIVTLIDGEPVVAEGLRPALLDGIMLTFAMFRQMGLDDGAQ